MFPMLNHYEFEDGEHQIITILSKEDLTDKEIGQIYYGKYIAA